MPVAKNSLNNLKPPTTSEEARERGRKGGIKSGEIRRERKALRQVLDTLLTLPVGFDMQRETLIALGIDEEECNNQTLITVAMIQAAAGGDVKAATWIRDTVGEKPTDKIEANIQKNPLDDQLAQLSPEEIKALAGYDDE
ncbi:hypothetical protein EOM57_01055 [Candidatus Saccharibacteria bacterium]|nr:hypothetical protein [Candidatus Saccharibacteria bacterium]